MLVVAAICYAVLLTHSRLNLFGADAFGLTYNSMLDHMLHGGWDVDPAAIGKEAFLHDGRAYAYFGPFPAVLRLPLLLLPHAIVPDWRRLHVERLSCWIAMMVGVWAQIGAVTRLLAEAAPAVRRRLAPPLLAACALSGAPMLLGWKGAVIYHEAILWAWALAMVFVALALPLARAPRSATWRRLCALGLCAGLCLLTRVFTGAALFVATTLLLLLAARRRGDWYLLFWGPAGVLALFIVLAGLVNQGRWGNPLTFADLRLQAFTLEEYPDRLVRLQRHGLFEPQRADIGLLYYVAPVWTPGLERLLPLGARLRDRFDALELPASSLLLTDPAWCALAVLGVISIVRRHGAGGALLAGSLSLAPAMVLTAWSLTFRYRAEFEPLLFALSCLALADRAPGLAPGAVGRAGLGLTLLCALQVGSSAFAGWTYARQPFGPAPGYEAVSLRCLFAPGSCTP